MNISLRGKDNIFQQIVNEYKRLIELDVIKYDEKLPSCRMLAKDLGVNPNTVQKAYNTLEQEGYIMVIPKKGVYVCYKKKENINEDNIELKKIILKVKGEGISYDTLLSIINNVYSNND